MNDNPSQMKNDSLQMSNNNMQVYLELENGLKITGNVFGHKGCCTGELVFQTGLTGYPESMTDPSYAGQILVFTYPLIGNYGFPRINLDEWGLDKNTESEKNITPNVINNWVAIFLSIQPLIFYIYWAPLLNFIKSSLLMWEGM